MNLHGHVLQKPKQVSHGYTMRIHVYLENCCRALTQQPPCWDTVPVAVKARQSKITKHMQGRALTQQPPCWDTEPAAVKAKPEKVHARNPSLTQQPPRRDTEPVAVKDGPRYQVQVTTFPSMYHRFSSWTPCRRHHLSFQYHTARGHALLCATLRNPLMFITMLTMCWLPCLP